MKKRAIGPRARPGEQGLKGLGTWRIGGSADVKRRRQQTRELRRKHRVRAGGRPDSVLGTPEVHWSSPPRLGRKSFAGLTARGAQPKRRAGG